MQTSPPPELADLVQKARSGDAGAQEILIQRYQGRMAGLVWSFLGLAVFEPTIQAVVTYSADGARVLSVRGVAKGDYPRHDPHHRQAPPYRLMAAIESRPD